MKLSIPTSFALLAGLVSASAVPQKRNSGLDVKLTAVGNTKIKAIITNTGSTDFRLLTDGTLLDSAPVRKFHVSSSGK
jgi:deuterolysin